MGRTANLTVKKNLIMSTPDKEFWVVVTTVFREHLSTKTWVLKKMKKKKDFCSDIEARGRKQKRYNSKDS